MQERDLKDDAVKIEEVVRNLSLCGGLGSSIAARRLAKDFEEMSENPPVNISVRLKEGNIFKWEASIQGPVGSLYEKGTFLMDINFTDDYPFALPKVTFRTKIYHCSVGSDGKLSISILDDSQRRCTITVKDFLLSTISLLERPRSYKVSSTRNVCSVR